MKKRLYLVRHGLKEAASGDPALTNEGIEQARITGKYLKKYPIKKILSSPSLRTRQTAEKIAAYLNLPFTVHNDLRERANWGDDPEQSFDDFLEMWQKSTEERNWEPPIGSSSKAAGERLFSVIDQETQSDQEVMFVTHGGIIADFLQNQFDDSKLNKKIKECSVTIVEFDSEKQHYEIIELAQVEHLKNLLINDKE